MTALAFGTEHRHCRPGWDCGACALPWPCATAKAGLTAEFRTIPTALAIYMAGHMQEALIDLTSHGEPTPPDLYERFLAWIRHPCSEPAPSAAPPITAKRSAGRADGTGPSPARRRGSKRRQAAPASGKAALNTGGGASA